MPLPPFFPRISSRGDGCRNTARRLVRKKRSVYDVQTAANMLQASSRFTFFIHLFIPPQWRAQGGEIVGGERESERRQGAKGRRRRDEERQVALRSVAAGGGGGGSQKKDCWFSMQRTAGGLEATHCGPIALIGILVRRLRLKNTWCVCVCVCALPRHHKALDKFWFNDSSQIISWRPKHEAFLNISSGSRCSGPLENPDTK